MFATFWRMVWGSLGTFLSVYKTEFAQSPTNKYDTWRNPGSLARAQYDRHLAPSVLSRITPSFFPHVRSFEQMFSKSGYWKSTASLKFLELDCVVFHHHQVSVNRHDNKTLVLEPTLFIETKWDLSEKRMVSIHRDVIKVKQVPVRQQSLLLREIRSNSNSKHFQSDVLWQCW